MYQDYNNGSQQPPFYPEGDNYNYVQRQVSFGEAISRAFSNYCNFEGRASRSEFWWFWLFTTIVSLPFGVAGAVFQFAGMDEAYLAMTIVNYIISLALFLPSLGLAVRRLHDINKSGWWYLLNLACCVGGIVLIVWYCQDSDPVENEYGPVPNLEQC